jgi:hypothetical protein
MWLVVKTGTCLAVTSGAFSRLTCLNTVHSFISVLFWNTDVSNAWARTHTHTCTYIHTHIHAYIHAYVHTCIPTCSHTYVHACMWGIQWIQKFDKVTVRCGIRHKHKIEYIKNMKNKNYYSANTIEISYAVLWIILKQQNKRSVYLSIFLVLL